LARDGTIPRGARVLFVHTGGLPALFAYEPELTIVSPSTSEVAG
jgi:1-aminocyclopropane-1-carboxylate deaminase/D-cysteine desulfhydrase-like pyridoxal-dependent ACC family enzyme